MKTNEEQNASGEQVKTVNEKSAELTDEEMEQVSGGMRIQHNMTAANTNRQLGTGDLPDSPERFNKH